MSVEDPTLPILICVLQAVLALELGCLLAEVTRWTFGLTLAWVPSFWLIDSLLFLLPYFRPFLQMLIQYPFFDSFTIFPL